MTRIDVIISTNTAGKPNNPNILQMNPPDMNCQNIHRTDRIKNEFDVIWFSNVPVPVVELCTLVVTFAITPPDVGFVG